MKKILVVLLTICIPLSLVIVVLQSSRYVILEREIRDYNKAQYEIIEENKKKISGISILSRPQRIEKIAIEELKMRKANSPEILRIEITRSKNDG